MRPTLSIDKDILTPNGKFKTLNTINQTHNYLFFRLFLTIVHITDTYVIRIYNKCTETLTDPNWDGSVTEQTSIHRAIDP